MVYRIKANYEIIRHYRCTLFLYFDWLMEWSTWLWLANGVWHKMCDWLTELQMAVNAWVAFATKNLLTDCSAQASARIRWWCRMILRVACRGLPHTFTVLRSKHEQHRYSQLFYLGRKRENIKYKALRKNNSGRNKITEVTVKVNVILRRWTNTIMTW